MSAAFCNAIQSERIYRGSKHITLVRNVKHALYNTLKQMLLVREV